MAFPSRERAVNDPEFLQPYEPDDFADGDIHVPRGDSQGFLYRVDTSFISTRNGRANSVVILVLSARKPNWDYAFHNAQHFLAAEPVCCVWSPLFSAGDLLRFRLQANPTRRIKRQATEADASPGSTRVPVAQGHLLEWLERKLDGAEVVLSPEPPGMQTGYVWFKKDGGAAGQLFSVVFDGLIRVQEPEALLAAVASGIGSAKCFGFGLLSVIPYRES